VFDRSPARGDRERTDQTLPLLFIAELIEGARFRAVYPEESLSDS
jgi:hypothetical protein